MLSIHEEYLLGGGSGDKDGKSVPQDDFMLEKTFLNYCSMGRVSRQLLSRETCPPFSRPHKANHSPDRVSFRAWSAQKMFRWERKINPSLASCRISLQNHRFFYICYIF